MPEDTAAVMISGASFAEEMKLKEPITVNGDKVEYNPEKKIMVGTGNVEVLYKGMKLYADKVISDKEFEDAKREYPCARRRWQARRQSNAWWRDPSGW